VTFADLLRITLFAALVGAIFFLLGQMVPA
jgi:hypothetical protein